MVMMREHATDRLPGCADCKTGDRRASGIENLSAASSSSSASASAAARSGKSTSAARCAAAARAVPTANKLVVHDRFFRAKFAVKKRLAPNQRFATVFHFFKGAGWRLSSPNPAGAGSRERRSEFHASEDLIPKFLDVANEFGIICFQRAQKERNLQLMHRVHDGALRFAT
jgi:hypothetical protein